MAKESAVKRKVWQGSGVEGPCPYSCVMQDDISEIKDDLKILVADLNRRLGFEQASKDRRAKYIAPTGTEPTRMSNLKAAGYGATTIIALIGLMWKLFGGP
jgi:hypothetical protein